MSNNPQVSPVRLLGTVRVVSPGSLTPIIPVLLFFNSPYLLPLPSHAGMVTVTPSRHRPLKSKLLRTTRIPCTTRCSCQGAKGQRCVLVSCFRLRTIKGPWIYYPRQYSLTGCDCTFLLPLMLLLLLLLPSLLLLRTETSKASTRHRVQPLSLLLSRGNVQSSPTDSKRGLFSLLHAL